MVSLLPILLRSYTTHGESAAILERWIFEKALISLDYPEEAFHYITAVCTVDLEMPNSVAAERTVARLSMMYAAKSQARSSIFVYKYTTPHTLVLNLYESLGSDMCRPAGWWQPHFLTTVQQKAKWSPAPLVWRQGLCYDMSIKRNRGV